MSERVHLLGIPIDPVTSSEAVDHIRNFLNGDSQHHVMTPNSEMIVASRGHEPFRRVLEKSDLNLPDSVGLLFAARLTGQEIPERVTGVDTVSSLCTILTNDQSVYLLGAESGIAERAGEALLKLNPELLIVGADSADPDDAEILDRINAAAPRLLLVAYGAPRQDLWIQEHLSKLASVRVAMGVGGTFDFLAGTAVRAPKLMQMLGLEWLWRVIREPHRIGRILNAVVVFPLLVLRYGKE